MALERIKGDKARRYRDTETGAIVSRHAAEIRPRLEALGYTDAHQRAEVRKKFSYVDEPLNDDMEILWNEARREGFSKKRGGKLAQFLEGLGIRDASAEYDVGETPK